MTMGKNSIVPISLLDKLQALDEDILKLWISDSNELDEDDRWEIFVVLLETRVALLKTCKDAGIKLDADLAWPRWLDSLTNSRKEIRLRELKKLFDDLKKHRYLRRYEKRQQLEADQE
jgi:hypothetical protein